MEKIYYKELIKKYGFYHIPKMTAKIFDEAHLYNWWRYNLKPFWKDIASEIGVLKSVFAYEQLELDKEEKALPNR